MRRREFTVEAAFALLGGAAITISGCGGSSPTASQPLTDVAGTVGSNHGHMVTITAAQLGTGGSVELDIRGSSGHTHTVLLTAAEVALIRNGAVVHKESSGASHSHTVSFNM